MLLNQDNGQGIVILDKNKYIENDPTKRTETKLQKLLMSLKNNKHVNEEDYKRIYPKSSRPGLFYGTAKVHKLKD